MAQAAISLDSINTFQRKGGNRADRPEDKGGIFVYDDSDGEKTPEEAVAEQDARDPDNLANPTELAHGADSGGPDVHTAGPAEA